MWKFFVQVAGFAIIWVIGRLILFCLIKKGRDFYAEKDKKMAEIAHYDFVLWDGKSVGSLNNIREMLAKNKFSLVYHSPRKQFVRIKSFDELQALIDCKNPQLIDEMVQKGNVYLKSLISPQVSLI